MKIGMIAAVAIAAAATSLPLAAIARADVHYEFQSPSGNIGCDLYAGSDGTGIAHCEIRDQTWVIAAPVPNCGSNPGGWQFSLDQGKGPGLGYSCAAGTLSQPGLATLDYGQTRSAGAITCDSEPAGMTCTDTGNGDYFRLSPESYVSIPPSPLWTALQTCCYKIGIPPETSGSH
jgi:hypothetical protein